MTPVSPEYASDFPSCSMRMAYASTGWRTRSVCTVNGPISNVPGFTVWKSKTSLIEEAVGVSAYAVVSRCSVPSGRRRGAGRSGHRRGGVAARDEVRAHVDAVVGVQMAEEDRVEVVETAVALQLAKGTIAHVEKQPKPSASTR